MKRFLPSFSRSGSEPSPSSPPAAPRRPSQLLSAFSTSSSDITEHPDDSPEGILLREVAAFCETSGAESNTQGNEFVHLPVIVEKAESSPNAAKVAAVRIRKYLAQPTNSPSHVQYNAIMLMRILAENPGHTFTRHFDAKFVSTVRELLRLGRDLHVQHYLRQYLDQLEQNRAWDEDFKLLLQMWAKEKVKTRKLNHHWPLGGLRSAPAPQPQPAYPQNYNGPPPAPAPPANVLPGPEELAARVEESRNSAKLLTQFVQTTPPAEMEGNELIKEFVDRCRASSRTIQSYIHGTNPPPDEDTLQTLIETNDEISVALSQQQRALLKARKARASLAPTPTGGNSASSSPAPSATAVARGGVRPVPAAPSREEIRTEEPLIPELASTEMSGARPAAPSRPPGRYEYNSADFHVQNPFADDFASNDPDDNRPLARSNFAHDDGVHFEPARREV